MKKIVVTLTAWLLLCTAHAQKTIIADDHAVQRTVSGSFSSIKVSGSIELYLSQYDTESVAVSAPTEESRNNIKTVVENGTLNIYYDGSKIFNWKSKNLKVYVSFKNLDKLAASGASDVLVNGTIAVPALEIQCSGASNFKGVVKIDQLKLDLSGASDVKISGTAATVGIKASGASDVKGYDLITDNCTAHASGASDINITVNKEMNVHASGASDVYFKGAAVIKDMQSSGSSTVSRKE